MLCEQSRQGRGVTILQLGLQGRASSSGLPACGALKWEEKQPPVSFPKFQKCTVCNKGRLWPSWLSKGHSTVQGSAKSSKTPVAKAFCYSLSGH